MSKRCLIAAFSDRESFATALEVLETGDFTEDSVSLVTRPEDVSQTEAAAAEDRTPASPPDEKTTAASTLAGGALGALVATPTMIGPFIVAGPLLGMAAGAVGGGLLSSVESWGVRHDVGQQYEQRLERGERLIIITDEQTRLDQAERLLKTCDHVSIERYQAKS